MSNKTTRDLVKVLLNAFQKGLKLFVEYKMKGSRCRRQTDRWIQVYVDGYIGGRYRQGLRTVWSLRTPASATRGGTTGSFNHLG